MLFDVFVIGGGVNGAGIARDAQGRGLKVFLAEQNDLASATSSASTKLIHGGLRYLEHYEFRLVREALIEREVLLKAAPHIIWPLRFVLPHHQGLRPRALIRLGLFLYDHLGGRKLLPGTRSLDLTSDAVGKPLRETFTHAWEYSDCWVDDARLVVLNARDAADRGAVIRTRCRCVKAQRTEGLWEVTIETPDGVKETVKAKALVNAAGAWVRSVLDGVVQVNATERIRMVKGSHIVVDRIFDHDRCYIFQNADGRICFAIPYEQDFTLVGTTDEDYQGDPAQVAITDSEIDYLIASAGEYFRRPLSRDMIRWSYSGVRPLYDDGASAAQAATRDYVLKLDGKAGEAPLLSVFGGKITTFRKLAEAALAKLGSHFPAMGKPWTAGAALPGGDFAPGEFDSRCAALQRSYSFFPPRVVRRMFRAYGSKVEDIFNGARFAADMGERFGPLSAREVDYLVSQEWARTADDILWRRTKLGLHMSRDDQERLRAHMAERTDIKP